MSEVEAVRLRSMTPDDVALGMRLKTLAGWNQRAADWEMLLRAGVGLVAVVEAPEGTTVPVGTATVVPYADVFSWIGMVLVDPAYRRRGIGTRLLEASIALARRHGVPRLDATPQGEPLYQRLGFNAEYGLVRLRRESGVRLPAASGAGGANVRCETLTSALIEKLVRYDASVFGAPRPVILTALRERAPRYAYAAWRDRDLVGYILGRPGSDYDQIGPLLADDPEVAQALLRSALARCGDRRVILDVPVDRGKWLAFLEGLGFARQRPFTRMALGTARTFGQPARQYAIAGPEIG
ncbi:MAG: GNAT family N-acetyltransferase [Anaerolineae bacterium]